MMRYLLTIIVLLASGLAQAGDKHFFYMHGCCLSRVGSGGYASIVREFGKSGLDVKYERRYDDSDEALQAFAQKIAGQVRALLAQGVPPEDITVSGYSIGSALSMYVAIALANPKINYVLFAGCPGSGARAFDIDYPKVQGRVLSIFDEGDDRFGSCKGLLPESVLKKELALSSGQGHMIFQNIHDFALRLWKDPAEAWAKGQ
jgi:hypothetical protein